MDLFVRTSSQRQTMGLGFLAEQTCIAFRRTWNTTLGRVRGIKGVNDVPLPRLRLPGDARTA
jgi:hypothetical protein